MVTADFYFSVGGRSLELSSMITLSMCFYDCSNMLRVNARSFCLSKAVKYIASLLKQDQYPKNTPPRAPNASTEHPTAITTSIIGPRHFMCTTYLSKTPASASSTWSAVSISGNLASEQDGRGTSAVVEVMPRGRDWIVCAMALRCR
jgi:hypothetical protein